MTVEELLRLPIAKVITDFSQAADKLESEYARFIRAQAIYAKNGLSWPFFNEFSDMTEQITKNRAIKITLLKELAKYGANPKDYGLTIKGLSVEEIGRAYPGLKYVVADTRLAAAPLVIAAAVLVSIGVAIAATTSVYGKVKDTNFVDDMAEEYQRAGMTRTEAVQKATNDLQKVREAGGKSWDKNLSGAVKWIIGGVVVIFVLTRFGKKS